MSEGRNSEPEVPKALEQHQKNKKAAEERAEDALEQEVTRGECFLAAIGYIGFLCVLPLVLLPQSKFAQFHGKQALVLAVFIYFLDVLRILPTSIDLAYNVVKIAIVLFAAYSALHAKMFRIPFIYDLSSRFQIHVQRKDQE